MPALSYLSGLLPFGPWKQKDDIPPPLTTAAASFLLVLYALSYFIPFYLSPTTRPSPTLSRDSPTVIRARIRSVVLTCTLCLVSTALILSRFAHSPLPNILHLTGIYPLGLLPTLQALLLTTLLFLGPLFHSLVLERSYTSIRASIVEIFTEPIGFRNIIAGPVTEELLFRSASVPLMLVAETSLTKTIFLSPIIFGLAHVHHFYEFRLTNPQVPAAAALARSIFQLAYTTLFGAYATFLFIRTGSLLAVCVVHAFCNCMGLPKVWGLLDGPGGRESRAWSVAYYVLLVAGAVGWYKNLWDWTVCENALVSPERFVR
ncbi:hypothetical protein OQA88_386 [Cercophora sp. LCS_1]